MNVKWFTVQLYSKLQIKKTKKTNQEKQPKKPNTEKTTLNKIMYLFIEMPGV